MRRFQFRLERLLDIRRWKEREWELALAKVLGECLLLENRITEIGVEIGASRLAVFTDGARVDVEAMSRRELYVQRLAAERERATKALVEKRREMEKVRARYQEASRERKVLDKFKDRRAEEYHDRQLDEEFKSVDDMNTAAAVRGGITEAAAVEKSSG
ncbi:MAG: flagellar export protein FliJ [Spirochaetia bacterium]